MASFTKSKLTSEIIASIINQDGSTVSPSDVTGKVVGIYFSAHWCPPCRNFTPLLANKYNEIKAAGHDFEIVFVSADEDEESAKSYFESMPWKMIKYSNRDAEQELSSAFEVEGIPTLVLLGPDGSLITTEGRQFIMEKPFDSIPTFMEQMQAERAERENFKASSFFADKSVKSKEGETVDASSLNGKLVGLYFSAHWCPPCRGFTPVLAKKYQEVVAAGHAFEVIFVSSDRDEASAASYFGEMPWKMLDFQDREAKAALSKLFQVRGIPTLVLVNDQGLVSVNGREVVTTKPFEQWAEK